VKRGGGVAKIAGRKEVAAPERFGGATDEHAVHRDFATRRELLGDKLMLCGNVREQHILAARKLHGFAFTQIRQRYESVVSRIKPQDAALCCSIFRHVRLILYHVGSSFSVR
jgi:hypothetical protein